MLEVCKALARQQAEELAGGRRETEGALAELEEAIYLIKQQAEAAVMEVGARVEG
jgi:hypothetical protein